MHRLVDARRAAEIRGMRILGLHIADVAIIAASLLAVMVIGLRASRGVESGSDFFVGGRKIGPFLQFFLNFGMMTDPTAAPTISTEVYRQGVGGIWIGFQTLFLTPFYWFSSVWFRRTRLVTGADLFVDRFNSGRLAVLFAAISVLTLVMQLSLGNIISFKAASAMIVKPEADYSPADRQAVDRFLEFKRLKSLFAAGQLSPAERERYAELESMSNRGELHSYISYVNQVPFYAVYTIIVGSYVMLGGLKAAAITDAFQGILIITLSILLVPIGLSKIGGFHALHRIVPEYNFRLFGTESVSEYAWYSILAIIFTSLVTVPMPGGNASANASAKDEESVRTGVIAGAFGKRLIMVTWMLCGLLAIAVLPRGGVSDPDNVWGLLSFTLLAPGLMGVMISSMLLGHMPAVGGNAVNISALVTRNLYEPLAPNRSERHYMIVAKVAVGTVLVAGVLLAMFFSGVITALTTVITFNAYFGAVGFLIFFWRRLTAPAVEWGLAAWVALMIVAAWILPQFGAFRRIPSLLAQTPPRVVTVISPATAQDVEAGRAAAVGQGVTKTRVLNPVAIYFDSIARVNPDDPQSPYEGVGRFQVENYLLAKMRLPLNRFNGAGLLTARWLFDGICPYVLLIGLSYLTGRRPQQRPRADERIAPTAPWPVAGAGSAEAMSQAVAMVEAEPVVAIADEPTRIARFYVKMKTPVAPDRVADEHELAESFANPNRFDHLKLFPRSNWEFTKWSRSDVLGFLGCWAGVLAVLAVLWLALAVGR
jgi:Na+/proline symporter